MWLERLRLWMKIAQAAQLVILGYQKKIDRGASENKLNIRQLVLLMFQYT